MSRRVLIISNDVVGARMAGPGIRCWELARVLARTCDVSLAHPGQDRGSACATLRLYPNATDPLELRALVAQSEIVLVDPWSLYRIGSIPDDKFVIADIYDPFVLENLEIARELPLSQRSSWSWNDSRLIAAVMERADFMLCASERQADFWLGTMVMACRVNHATYEADPSLASLLAVVPFGLPSAAAQASGPYVRNVRPEIGAIDPILVWGGGVWNWVDPLTIIRAVARLSDRYPGIRLVFPGMRPPNPIAVDMKMRQSAIGLARELGLLGRRVFFGDWVPYELRANYLLESDLGISLHFRNVETRMAFRTRVLDYIWAGLPMVVTEGDTMSDWVQRWGLGEIVGYEDVDGVAGAVDRLLSIPDRRAFFAPAFARAAADLSWGKVAEPLVAFCCNPHHAADRPPAQLCSGGDGLGTIREREQQRSPLPMAAGPIPDPQSMNGQEESTAARAAEIERLRELVAGYEGGRFIRLSKHVHRWLRGR